MGRSKRNKFLLGARAWLIIGISLLVILSLLIFYHPVVKSWLEPEAKPATFAQLKHWRQTDLKLSWKAFRIGCKHLLKLKPDHRVGSSFVPMKASDWTPVCKAALKNNLKDNKSIRIFFQRWFDVYAIYSHEGFFGLFTSYFLPTIPGRLHKEPGFGVPIYGRPDSLVTVHLEKFSSSWSGINLSGEVKDGALIPYAATRKKINNNQWKPGPVLAWTDTRMNRLIMQIQGSGLISLPNNKSLLLGYAAENGQKMIMYGATMKKSGYLKGKKLTMSDIIKWSKQHPKLANKLMEKDKSFVFFRPLKTGGVVGAARVALTPGISLAVDERVIPFFAPLWLETGKEAGGGVTDWHRLMMAQDSGGAINGVVRGDIYLGGGSLQDRPTTKIDKEITAKPSGSKKIEDKAKALVAAEKQHKTISGPFSGVHSGVRPGEHGKVAAKAEVHGLVKSKPQADAKKKDAKQKLAKPHAKLTAEALNKLVGERSGSTRLQGRYWLFLPKSYKKTRVEQRIHLH